MPDPSSTTSSTTSAPKFLGDPVTQTTADLEWSPLVINQEENPPLQLVWQRFNLHWGHNVYAPSPLFHGFWRFNFNGNLDTGLDNYARGDRSAGRYNIEVAGEYLGGKDIKEPLIGVKGGVKFVSSPHPDPAATEPIQETKPVLKFEVHKFNLLPGATPDQPRAALNFDFGLEGADTINSKVNLNSEWGHKQVFGSFGLDWSVRRYVKTLLFPEVFADLPADRERLYDYEPVSLFKKLDDPGLQESFAQFALTTSGSVFFSPTRGSTVDYLALRLGGEFGFVTDPLEDIYAINGDSVFASGFADVLIPGKKKYHLAEYEGDRASPALQVHVEVSGKENRYQGEWFHPDNPSVTYTDGDYVGGESGEGGFGRLASQEMRRQDVVDRELKVRGELSGSFVNDLFPEVDLTNIGIPLSITPDLTVGMTVYAMGAERYGLVNGRPYLDFGVGVSASAFSSKRIIRALSKQRGEVDRQVAIDDFNDRKNMLTKNPVEKYKKAIKEIDEALAVFNPADPAPAQSLYDGSVSKAYKEALGYFTYVLDHDFEIVKEMRRIVTEELDFDREKMGIVEDLDTSTTLFDEATTLQQEASVKMRDLETKLAIPDADRLAR